MKRIFFICFFSIIALVSRAEDVYWTPENIPMVHLQDSNRYVSNPDNVLGSEAVYTIDTLLRRLESEAGVQSVVVVVKHIKGDDPYQFGQAVADKYGIGHKKRDDGLFVMLCTEDRSYTILTGEGMEGVLPDAICRRIQDKIMVPLLRQSDWDGAMIATMKAIDTYIRADESFKQSYYEDGNHEDEKWLIVLVFTLFFGTLGLVIYLVCKLTRKVCPKCKKKKMYLISESMVYVNGKKMSRRTYKCSHCKYKETVDKEWKDNDWHITTHSGLGGGGGFSRGGGFGGGGHFGGGHFGGGGSTGRF